MKILSKLKQEFLAQMPVIGPHASIEADLMLAGKKPLAWFPVIPDEQKEYYSDEFWPVEIKRRKLDEAVSEGKLISKDVACTEMDGSETIFRHYATPSNEDSLSRLSKLNDAAFNDKDMRDVLPLIEKDIGLYLGYRKRDVLFFHLTQRLPQEAAMQLIKLNASAQIAYQEKMLEGLDQESGPE